MAIDPRNFPYFQPCPFCGNRKVEASYVHQDPTYQAKVVCNNCHVTMYDSTMLELSAKWNTRVDPDQYPTIQWNSLDNPPPREETVLCVRISSEGSYVHAIEGFMVPYEEDIVLWGYMPEPPDFDIEH